MTILDESLEPPERPDFRRAGKGVPMVIDPSGNGKWLRYRRASSAGNILDDDSNLVDWAKRTIVEGAAQRPDIMAHVSTLDHELDKKAIRDAVEECLVSGKGTQRAVTGTAIHKMLDHVDLGHDWAPAPQFKAAVDAYVAMLDLYGLVPVDVEAQCVNDTYRIAGTMDRRYRTTRNLITPTGEIIPIGSIVGADTKTGQSLEYASGSYATQLAAYTHPDTVRYDVRTNERTPFDPPTYQAFALIVHVDASDGRCDTYWVDLDAGRHALALSDKVREWRKRTDLIVPAPAPLYVVPKAQTVDLDLDAMVTAAARQRHPSHVPALASVAPVEPSNALPATDEPPAPADALADVRAWLRGRIDVIKNAGEMPLAMLMREWPQGVPGLKHDGQTEAMLDAISDVVWRVEGTYSLPFPTSDPRTPVEAPRDFSSRWSKPTGKDDPRDDLGDGPHFEFAMQLEKHPRKALIHRWVKGKTNARDNWALVHALYEFAMLPLDEWSDDDVTEMLDGTLRAIGYADGVKALGDVIATDAPLIMSSAFGITAGNAMLLYGEDGKPVVRIIG